MKEIIRQIYLKEAFYPTWFLGIWINPAFIVRRSINKGISDIASKFIGGELLDVGCGSKPYKDLFQVEQYIGIDIEISGHNHNLSKVDKFYDGKQIPFNDEKFDWVFSSEVFEHVFNLDELLQEINRVLKQGGKLAFTCPFVWDEHEQPYDFARYTSFGLEDLLQRNGFKVESLKKSSTYFETLMQLIANYIYQNCLPKNRYLITILMPFIVSPFNIIGSIFGKFFPNNKNLYLNNIVIANKI
jgi:SAM-dependent methyltransferase